MWRFVNENLTVQAIISQKTKKSKKNPDLCLPLPQIFQKIFAHKSKFLNKSEYICGQLK